MSNLKKIISLLTPAELKQGCLLLILMLIGAVLEMASIGMVLPLLTLMAKESFLNDEVRTQIMSFLGNPSQNQMIFIGIGSILGVYFSKTLYLMFLAWRQNAFIYGVRAALADRLFEKYLSQAWASYIQRNSAKLISILTNETNQFGVYILQPLLVLASEMLIIFAICILLILIEPIATISIFILLGLVTFLMYSSTKKHLAKWGSGRMYHERYRIQHVQQGLGGLKEIKLLGRENVFINHHHHENIMVAKMVQRQNTMMQLPRLWIEFLAIAMLSAFIIVSVIDGNSIAKTLATLAVFAGAAYKLIPSVTKIISAMQSLRYGKSVINLLIEEQNCLPEISKQFSDVSLSFNDSIIFENVSYQYSEADNLTIDNVSFKINKGQCVGFMGESGSGKSTIIDILLGLLTPRSGYVKVDGINIGSAVRSWQNQVGYVPQSIFLTDDTLRRNIAFGIEDHLIDEAAIHNAVNMAQLSELLDSLPDGLETNVGERGVKLSGGQKQRIGIARALYHNPNVLVLDEATSALDISTEANVMEAINNLIGIKTIIIIAHRISTLTRCDKVFIIDKGKLSKEGSYSEITNVKYVDNLV